MKDTDINEGRERRENLYLAIAEMLSKAEDMETGINGVLAYVGKFLEADRVYVFEIEPEPGYASITFEWDSEEGISHKDAFQHFYYDKYSYRQLFDLNNLVCCTDLTLLPDGQIKELLEAQNLKATIQYGIYDKGVFSGMVGIDDCKRTRPEWNWDQEQLMTLHFIANLFSMYLFKERSIQKQKLAEQTLREKYKDSNTRLTTFIDGINGGFKISKNESKFPFHYVSEAMAAIQGYTPEELTSLYPTAVDNAHPEDVAKNGREMMKSFISTGKYTIKYRVRHKNGKWIWVQDNGKLVVLPNGTELVYSLIQDIDASERANTVLQTERAMFRDVLTKDAAFIFTTDVTTGQIIDNKLLNNYDEIFNGEGAPLPCDYDQNGEIFVNIFDAVPLTEPTANYFKNSEIMRIYLEGVNYMQQEYYLRAVDKYVRVDDYITVDPSNNHIISNTVCFNITEEKKKEIAAKEQAKKAEEQLKRIEELTMANRINNQFIQNMSHEIRTPLNAILGFSSVLVDPTLSETMSTEEKKGLVDLITHNSKLLTDIIDDVLGMSDLQNGKLKVAEGEVDIEKVCKSCMKSVEHRLPRGVQMFYTSDIPEGFVINSDMRRIEQVIINFLTNATKHTTEGSISVGTSLKEKPGYICIAVTDTGKGIPAEKAEVIFERFEKLDVFTQGSGLGLAICKLVADILNGKVWLDTTYDKGGARFVFALPLK